MLPSDVEFMHPVRHMGYHADVRKSSRTPQRSRVVKEKVSLGRADQNIKLHDQLKLEKPISKSYGDLHHEVKQTPGDGLLFPRKSVGNNQKQSVERKVKDDELVKHMSNLPRYLQRVERGDNVQEKVLNFGVLDWGRLEKWKYNQLPVAHRSVMHSPSTSNDSSPFSTVGSSTLSTISDSGILVHRKQSPSRGAHLASSSKDCHSMGVKPSRANVPAPQDKTAISKCASVEQQIPPITNASSQRSNSKMKFEKGMKNDMHSKFITVLGTSSSNSKSCEVSISPKGKAKVPGDEYLEKTERFQSSTSTGQHCPGSDKTIVLLLPKNLSKNRFSGHNTRNAEFAVLNESKQKEASRSSFSDGFSINDEVQFSELYSDIPHSCPQLSRTEPGKQSVMKLPRSVDGLVSKIPSDASHSSRDSREMHTVRSEHMQAEENKLPTTPTNLVATECSKGSRAEVPSSAKRGNLSPNRWPSVGKGKMSRSFSYKEDSALPQLSSTYVTTKSGPVESDVCSDIASREKTRHNSRGRSSPLRRLLDPLLRPKTANRQTSVESLHDEAQTVGKSADAPLPSSVRPVKRNLNFLDSVPTDANGAEQDEKHGASMVQALLQVTVKNGLPWFTFAVDNSSDILAATMRKTNSSEKYDCSWIYTFYSFHKAKKKSGGWMGHGSKARNGDYIPNIIGQMRVNGSRSTNSTKHGYKGQLTTREFVLVDVESKKADQDSPNLVSNAELAAMVIKVPTESMRSLTSDRKQNNGKEDLLHMKLEEGPLDGKCSQHSLQNLKRGNIAAGNQNLSSIVVVLPSGVHGLSATGSPSPLLDRWKSGGSCDCGGWDIGCQLNVLSNRGRHAKNLDATESCCAQDNFDLFIQGGGSQESIPSLRFGTFNKGVHSVDFNASISSLQAFSICISFLHCKNLAKVSSLFHEITAQEPIAMESERMKLSTQMDVMTPSSCAPYPPPSPVGRV